MRRYGEPFQSEQSYRRRPGAYGILMRGRDVLLTHQMAPVPEFQLPGGGIDPGEGPLQALHREVMEETGWRIGHIRRIATFRRYTYMPEYKFWADKVCTIFLASPVRCLAPPSEAGHIAVWMPIEDAVQQLGNPGDAACLAGLLSGSNRS